MTDDDGSRFFRRVRAQLADRGLGLLHEDIDDVAGALLAERTETPQECLAGECRGGAERVSTHNVGAAADARIVQHRRALADLFNDRRQDIDRCRQGVDLPAAVVRHEHAVNAERDRFLGILRMHDAFDDQRSFPAVAILRDFIPGEGAAHLAAGKCNHIVDRGVLAGVFAQVRKPRDAILAQRHSPRRRHQHLYDLPEIGIEGAAESDDNLACACRAHRHVERKH